MATYRNIVITGASGGIGQALAKAYAGQGVTLGLLVREAARAEDLARECRALGATVVIGEADVRDRAALHGWLAEFDAAHPVDLVFANAGVTCGLGAGRSRESDADAERLAEVNYKGAVNTVSGLVEAMRTRRAGRIVLISSLAGMRAVPDMPSYSATKAALIAYGVAIRGWLRPSGVGVTVVCPGFVTSPMSARHRGDKPFEMSAEKAARTIRRAIARGRTFHAFPWQMAMLVRAWSLLPARLGDLVYHPMRARVEKDPRAEL